MFKGDPAEEKEEKSRSFLPSGNCGRRGGDKAPSSYVSGSSQATLEQRQHSNVGNTVQPQFKALNYSYPESPGFFLVKIGPVIL